jgi:hypothetical protein
MDAVSESFAGRIPARRGTTDATPVEPAGIHKASAGIADRRRRIRAYQRASADVLMALKTAKN